MKNHFNDYFDELVTNGFFPKITLPKRIGERSSSLIDNNFTNDTEKRHSRNFTESFIRSSDYIYLH